ncbi:uncharacterized protein BO66DRAFT_406121 [Aspergillus aculeatinus CBS 121060]|uniref:Uncharacterized protein n=1 Tax=Aspergillus aculeatinus CBS 121060 TaxID=1448322 RepID=A0ACD1GUA0_9EURO|nr:hypothetical protein BO66DRAFT_406121 [Aspergillus aculeatinus CBS 121060]RAH64775.1 hypothetical protein BO66DRAFT_406121 [Aspergillus aculeatinus CBS 121060]
MSWPRPRVSRWRRWVDGSKSKIKKIWVKLKVCTRVTPEEPAVARLHVIKTISLSSSSSLETVPAQPPVSSATSLSKPIIPRSQLSIETFPVEIQTLILSCLSYEDLTSLTMASPVHYRVLQSGKKVLWNLVTDSLRGLIPEAQAVYCSGLVKSAKARTRENIAEMVEEYRLGRLRSQEPPPRTTKSTFNELSRILRFHYTVILPLVPRFTTWMQANLPGEAKLGLIQLGSPMQPKISSTEESRIIRALYRFQLCCYLFGNPRDDSPWGKESYHPGYVDILQHLEAMFHAWEIEEILCVHTFVEDIYPDIFDVVRGLWLLQRALCQMEDTEHPAQLVEIMRERLTPESGFIGPREVTSHIWFWNRLNEYGLTEKDLRSQAHEAFPFRGDHVPDPKGEFPPRAWTLMWRDTYSNLYGEWIPGALRSWGYVFWDAGRMETEAKEVLLWRWERSFDEDWDPRDEYDLADVRAIR